MKTLMREPLVHFSLMGLALFVLFSFVKSDDSNYEIVIDAYDVNEIVSKWRMQWNRDPTADEFKAMLDNYIKEEIMYREAKAMNLDHNDEVVRRRMAQKLQFLSEDISTSFSPSDDELASYLGRNAPKYAMEKIISFDHLYFSPDKRTDPESSAIAALNEDQPLGDPCPVRSQFRQASLSLIRSELGTDFAKAIAEMGESGEWQGPVRSGLGFHLVKVVEVVPGRLPTLEQVREKVTRDFMFDYRTQFQEELLAGLLEKYEVTFDLEVDTLSSL